MKKTFLFLLVIGFAAFSTLFAQHNGEGLYLKLGSVFPSREFNNVPDLVLPGQNSFYSDGGAMTGASWGLKFNYEFSGTDIEDWGLGVFLSAECMWNTLKKGLKKQYEEVSCKKPMYFNIPILAGISYTTPGEYINGWVEYGLGADILVKSKEGWKNNMVKYKPGVSFAMQCGAGILLVDAVAIGAHYYWLGKQNVTATSGQVINTSSIMKSGVWTVNVDFIFGHGKTYVIRF